MKLIIYRIFSFLLLPMAIIFSISVLLFLRAAFSNPAMLLPLFLFACVAVYSFASFNFLIRGIDGKKQLGKSSKDWLKVNAIASGIFALIIISQCIVFLLRPELIHELAVQAKQNAGTDLKMSDSALQNYLRVSSYFFIAYFIVLFIHIILSFQYIKLYNYLFRNEKNENRN